MQKRSENFQVYFFLAFTNMNIKRLYFLAMLWASLPFMFVLKKKNEYNTFLFIFCEKYEYFCHYIFFKVIFNFKKLTLISLKYSLHNTT